MAKTIRHESVHYTAEEATVVEKLRVKEQKTKYIIIAAIIGVLVFGCIACMVIGAMSEFASISTPTVVPLPTPNPLPTLALKPTVDIVGTTGLSEPVSSVTTIKPGMHIVGTDVEPGIYMGLASDCYWERLSGLSGTFDEIIANGNAEGLFYVEIIPTDVAFSTQCIMEMLNKDVSRDELLPIIVPGTYIVHRDVGPGVYHGSAETDSCYWERLSCVSGEFACIVANDNATGQFFVEVLSSDFAIHTSCALELIND